MISKGGKSMLRKSRYLAVGVLLLGAVIIAIGATFVVQGQAKANYMKEAMRLEQITLGLSEDVLAQGEFVDSASEAQEAADTVRGHRQGSGTYSDALAGGRFDPANPDHLSYAQALNLENYLYLAVAGFGLTTVAIVSGISMIVTGLALGGTGIVLFGLARKEA